MRLRSDDIVGPGEISFQPPSDLSEFYGIGTFDIDGSVTTTYAWMEGTPGIRVTEGPASLDMTGTIYYEYADSTTEPSYAALSTSLGLFLIVVPPFSKVETARGRWLTDFSSRSFYTRGERGI